MTSGRPSVRRLQLIDESNRHAHSNIFEEDRCYFLREYTAKVGGWRYGETNDLIDNFQKSPKFRGKPPWERYKQQAIARLADELRAAFSPSQCVGLTFVPTPPSKMKGDPEHDDRILRLLARFSQGVNLDIRELVLQTASTETSKSLGGARWTWDQLAANYVINEDECVPEPGRVMVVDDVLTTGSHFRAMKHIIQRRFDSVSVEGLFLARTVY